MRLPGGKAQRLRPDDISRAHRLLDECTESWADGPSWREHLCRGTAQLLGGSSGTYLELHITPTGVPRCVEAATITGLDDSERAHFDQAMRDIAVGQIAVTGHDRMMREVARRGAVVAERHVYAPDAVWYASRFFQEYRRPAGLDHNVVSFRLIEPGWLCILAADRPVGEPPLGRRALRLMTLLSAQLVARLGAPLATQQHLGLHGLPPRLTQTLRALLRGRSPKQIATELGISIHTVRQYIADLHDRFDVRSNAELLAYFIRRRPHRRHDAGIV